MNILIKLMSIVALVIAPTLASISGDETEQTKAPVKQEVKVEEVVTTN